MKINIWNRQEKNLSKDMIKNSRFIKKKKLSHKNNKIKLCLKDLKE